MDRPRIYVETTIPSAYFDERTAPEMVARRAITREWWENAAGGYELVSSTAVREELLRGPIHMRERWVSLLRAVQMVKRTATVRRVAAEYIRHKVMPAQPLGDALHLALASYYECDFLLTWNYKHLVNPKKFGHIRQVNRSLGLFVPRIVTPRTLLEEGA